MSISDKAVAIKALLNFCIDLLPKVVAIVYDLISLIKEVKTA